MIAELNGGVLRIQDETGRWHLEDSNVQSFQFEGIRIAILKTDGVLEAKDGLDASRHREEDSVRSYQLEGPRIAVMKSDGTLKVKEGLDAR